MKNSFILITLISINIIGCNYSKTETNNLYIDDIYNGYASNKDNIYAVFSRLNMEALNRGYLKLVK